MAKARMPMPPPIADSGTAAALLSRRFDGLAYEQLCVLNLDAKLRPLGLTCAPPGTADRVALPLRALIAEALRRDARKLILAHNHPAGDPTPSRLDRDATRQLTDVAHALGIAVIDHLIFAGRRWVSFRAMELL